ncbi:toprim domain-containing protein, partial [Yeosuana aromativorans]
RYIPITVAKRYCKEVWYQYKDNRFFAIGLENIKGGWELRNKLFKNGSSPKSYTHIQNSSKQLTILEGMFDLLSLATLDGTEIKASDIIVLNSIAFIKDIETHIGKYESVHLYLDNDSAGQQATKYLMDNYNHVKDRSSSYKNHKDLNDMICHEQRKQI